jgi:hypothetical protein
MNPKSELLILTALGLLIIYTLFVLDIGNENNFNSEQDCFKKCGQKKLNDPVVLNKCNLDVSPGPCYAYFERYFHNKTSQKCEQFVYGTKNKHLIRFFFRNVELLFFHKTGGCGGNQNNFEKLEDCSRECLKEVKPTGEISQEACALKSDPGLCRAFKPRFFFNSESNKCEEFIYGKNLKKTQTHKNTFWFVTLVK